mgnify:FL=1
MSSVSELNGLLEELESLKDRLREAVDNGDADKERYLSGRIERVEIEIDNLRYMQNR